MNTEEITLELSEVIEHLEAAHGALSRALFLASSAQHSSTDAVNELGRDVDGLSETIKALVRSIESETSA